MRNPTFNSRIESKFLTSAPNLGRCPEPNLNEVAFAGRSNAGKSSVLNQITGNKSLAKVSRTPGRTQMLNFFESKAGGYLVDLPGYGYAKTSKSDQIAWQRSVNEYLSFRRTLRALVLVMDIRRPNQEFDQELINWAKQSDLTLHILLNKSDKVGTNKKVDALRKTQLEYEQWSNVSIQTFSALKGDGRGELINKILCWFGDPVFSSD